jgi:hypothetical protein
MPSCTSTSGARPVVQCQIPASVSNKSDPATRG